MCVSVDANRAENYFWGVSSPLHLLRKGPSCLCSAAYCTLPHIFSEAPNWHFRVTAG